MGRAKQYTFRSAIITGSLSSTQSQCPEIKNWERMLDALLLTFCDPPKIRD